MKYKYTSRSEEDTYKLAENIESEKFPNMLICLNGELGSGKTVFVKGFANSLGLKENITSPTFNIIKEYLNGEMALYHVDAYRLEGKEDNIGLVDYFSKEGITIIEWSELIEKYLPSERLEIEIKLIDEITRVFVITPYGRRYEDICESIL